MSHGLVSNTNTPVIAYVISAASMLSIIICLLSCSKQQIECAPSPQYAEIDEIVFTRRDIATEQNAAYGKVELADVTVHCSQNEAYGTAENMV